MTIPMKNSKRFLFALSSNASCGVGFFWGGASVKGAFVIPFSLLTINPAKVHNSVPGNRPAIRRMDLERPISIQLDCPRFKSGKNWIGTFFFPSEGLLNHH